MKSNFYFLVAILLNLAHIISAQKTILKDSSAITISNTDGENQEIFYTTGDASYSFKSDRIINFSDKSNIKIPEGSTVSLIEKRDNKTIEAELRIRNEDYKLIFIKEGFLSERYSNEDEWLKNFLKMIVRSQQDKHKENSTTAQNDTINVIVNHIDQKSTETGLSVDIFLNTLKNIQLEKNRVDLLSSKITQGISLNDQKKIIGFIFGNFMDESNKVQLLTQLIDSPSYTKANNDYLISFIDHLQIENNKVMLLKKLIK
jgi:hypothetical protein